MQQCHTNFGFKIADLATYPRLRNMQVPRRQSEALILGDGAEVSKMT